MQPGTLDTGMSAGILGKIDCSWGTFVWELEDFCSNALKYALSLTCFSRLTYHL